MLSDMQIINELSLLVNKNKGGYLSLRKTYSITNNLFLLLDNNCLRALSPMQMNESLRSYQDYQMVLEENDYMHAPFFQSSVDFRSYFVNTYSEFKAKNLNQFFHQFDYSLKTIPQSLENKLYPAIEIINLNHNKMTYCEGNGLILAVDENKIPYIGLKNEQSKELKKFGFKKKGNSILENQYIINYFSHKLKSEPVESLILISVIIEDIKASCHNLFNYAWDQAAKIRHHLDMKYLEVLDLK